MQFQTQKTIALRDVLSGFMSKQPAKTMPISCCQNEIVSF